MPLNGLNCTVYIDDLLIITETEKEHLNTLDKVLRRVTEAGFKPSLKKIEACKNEVDFLRFALTGRTKGISQTIKKT